MSSLSGDDIEMAVTASATPFDKGATDSAGLPISDGGIESEENQACCHGNDPNECKECVVGIMAKWFKEQANTTTEAPPPQEAKASLIENVKRPLLPPMSSMRSRRSPFAEIPPHLSLIQKEVVSLHGNQQLYSPVATPATLATPKLQAQIQLRRHNWVETAEKTIKQKNAMAVSVYQQQQQQQLFYPPPPSHPQTMPLQVVHDSHELAWKSSIVQADPSGPPSHTALLLPDSSAEMVFPNGVSMINAGSSPLNWPVRIGRSCQKNIAPAEFEENFAGWLPSRKRSWSTMRDLARHEKRLGMSGEPLHGSVAEASPTSVHSLSSASSVFHPIEKSSNEAHCEDLAVILDKQEAFEKKMRDGLLKSTSEVQRDYVYNKYKVAIDVGTLMQEHAQASRCDASIVEPQHLTCDWQEAIEASSQKIDSRMNLVRNDVTFPPTPPPPPPAPTPPEVAETAAEQQWWHDKKHASLIALCVQAHLQAAANHAVNLQNEETVPEKVHMKASTSFKAVVSGVPGLLASTTDVKGGAAVVGCSVPCPPTLPLGPKKEKSPLKRIRIKKVPNCDKCRAKGKVRKWCAPCGGTDVCPHQRQKQHCKECGGNSICEHGKNRHFCKLCGGRGICMHGRRKRDCKDCGGSGMCIHRRRRHSCKCCGGPGICEHGRRRNSCEPCRDKPVVTCEHGRNKILCRVCNVNAPDFCEASQTQEGGVPVALTAVAVAAENANAVARRAPIGFGPAKKELPG